MTDTAALPYTHWAYFRDHDNANRCATQLDAAGYLTLIDPPGWDPRANGEVRPVEPDMTCWLLRAAKPLDDGEDLVARHGAVESMVRQHRGRYDGGETGWLPTGGTSA